MFLGAAFAGVERLTFSVFVWGVQVQVSSAKPLQAAFPLWLDWSCSLSVLTVSLGPPRRILTSGCLSRMSWKFHNISCDNTTFVFRQHMRLFSPPNCLPPVFQQRPSPFICLKFTTIFFDAQQKDLFQLPVSPAFHSPLCLLWTHSNTQKFDTSLTPGPACKESQGKQISAKVGWC